VIVVVGDERNLCCGVVVVVMVHKIEEHGFGTLKMYVMGLFVVGIGNW